MLKEKELDKLIELITRAISINENLLAEEKRLVEALTEKRDIDYLKASSDTINLLMRKEVLYNQAAQMYLDKKFNSPPSFTASV